VRLYKTQKRKQNQNQFSIPQRKFSININFVKNINMKSIFITFDQAYYEQIMSILRGNNIRGFTSWTEVQGRGTKTGDPHLGSHAWPSLNSAIITIVEDKKVKQVLEDLKALDQTSELMGLRAFVWNIEDMI
jgi:nitrogen regulatory protein PII